jgi:uncharacterized membrane protein
MLKGSVKMMQICGNFSSTLVGVLVGAMFGLILGLFYALDWTKHERML